MDSGSQYRHLIQDLQLKQQDLQRLLVEKQEENDKLKRLIFDLEKQVTEYEQSIEVSG